MGLYDRDYYRSDSTSGPGPFTTTRSIVTTLILINVAIFVLDVFTPKVGGGHWLSHHLAVKPESLMQPWNWWQFLTYGFAHAPLDSPKFILHVGFNMWGLWLFGRKLEDYLGRNEFLRLYLALIVLAGVVWAGVKLLAGGAMLHSMYGASGAVAGIVTLYALRFPHDRFQLILPPVPVPAWVVGLLLVFGDVVGVFGFRDPRVAYAVHLGGAGLAAAYHFSGIKLEGLLPNPSRWFKRRPRLRVHHPDRAGRAERQLESQADAVLDKLHREGEDSLTRKERRVLEDYSRRMRSKHE